MAKLTDKAVTPPPPAPTASPAAPTPASYQGAATEDAVPELGGRPRGIEPPPVGEVLPPFFLAAHRDRWGVINGRVVPWLRRLKGTPGANGVDRDSKGRPVMGLALAQAEEHGWQVIPWDVDGPGTSYLKRVKATGGWIDRWTTVYAGSAQQTFDEPAFVTWLAGLVEQGKLTPCPLYALLRLRESTERSITKWSEKGRADQYGARVERLKRDLAVVIAAIERIAPPGAPVTPASTEEASPEIAA